MPQVGDSVWNMQPGAGSLVPTRVTGVRNAVETGFVNVHTLQGQLRRSAMHGFPAGVAAAAASLLHQSLPSVLGGLH